MLTEQYTGSIHTDILGVPYYNAYQNVTALALRISEPNTETVPAVLLGAHFDSSIGTPGRALPGYAPLQPVCHASICQ